jgi:hypothetical protein
MGGIRQKQIYIGHLIGPLLLLGPQYALRPDIDTCHYTGGTVDLRKLESRETRSAAHIQDSQGRTKRQVLEEEGAKSGRPERDFIQRRGKLRLVYVIGTAKKIGHLPFLSR